MPDLESLQPLAGVIPGEIVGLGLNEAGVYGLTSSGLHGPLENSSAVVVGLAALCPTCGEFIDGPIAINDDWLAVATDGPQSRALWFSSDGSLLASNLVVEDEGTAAGLSADEFGAALVTTNDGRLLRLTSDGERAILHDGLLDGVELTPKNFDYRPDLGFILSGFGWSEPAVWLAGPVPENWVLDSAQFIGGTFSNSEITTFVGDLAWIKVEPFVLAAYVPGTGQQVAVMSLEAIADSESDRVRAVAAPRPRCE